MLFALYPSRNSSKVETVDIWIIYPDYIKCVTEGSCRYIYKNSYLIFIYEGERNRKVNYRRLHLKAVIVPVQKIDEVAK